MNVYEFPVIGDFIQKSDFTYKSFVWEVDYGLL